MSCSAAKTGGRGRKLGRVMLASKICLWEVMRGCLCVTSLPKNCTSAHRCSRLCSDSAPCPTGEGVGVSKQLCGSLAAGQGKPTSGVREYRLVFLASNNILQNEDTFWKGSRRKQKGQKVELVEMILKKWGFDPCSCAYVATFCKTAPPDEESQVKHFVVLFWPSIKVEFALPKLKHHFLC